MLLSSKVTTLSGIAIGETLEYAAPITLISRFSMPSSNDVYRSKGDVSLGYGYIGYCLTFYYKTSTYSSKFVIYVISYLLSKFAFNKDFSEAALSYTAYSFSSVNLTNISLSLSKSADFFLSSKILFFAFSRSSYKNSISSSLSSTSSCASSSSFCIWSSLSSSSYTFSFSSSFSSLIFSSFGYFISLVMLVSVTTL